MSSYHSLVDKFEKTKRELGEAESTIRRLTGREPDEIIPAVPGSGKYRLSSSASVPRRPSFSNRKKTLYTARKRSRELESSYEVESSSDDESPRSKKPALQSTVVAKRHQKRSRKATIEEQNSNSKVKARNRRMFGALIGTLEKFQTEEKQRQHQESMRAEVEQKVELANEEERERIKQEKEHLFVTRREKQTQLRCLEKKIERAESHDVFEANHHYLLNFIKTKTKPPIFFSPSVHTSETRRSLEESRSKIQEITKKRKQSFEIDLSEIEEWYRKDSSLPGDKENKRPKDESKSQDVPQIVLESLVANPTPTDAAHESNSNSSSNSDCNVNDDDNSSNAKDVGSLVDQDFEPIYD